MVMKRSSRVRFGARFCLKGAGKGKVYRLPRAIGDSRYPFVVGARPEFTPVEILPEIVTTPDGFSSRRNVCYRLYRAHYIPCIYKSRGWRLLALADSAMPRETS